MSDKWWRNGVVYQVYLRSFADGDGDGVGDLGGLRSRLTYLRRLGVDGIWLNPCYPSPGADHGYDVTDYLSIDDRYGGDAGLRALLDDAHALDLKILLDLVPNHCSSEHPWFKAALAGDPQARRRFYFRDAQGDLPPNSGRSTFGGPSWTRIGDQWYLHLFDPGQPDLDWSRPEVADDFDEVLRHWFDFGVDGMRLDALHMLFKDADRPDWPEPPDTTRHPGTQPGIHDVMRRWRTIADAYEVPRVLVGEVWSPTATDLAGYVGPDTLHQVFELSLLSCPWDAAEFGRIVRESLESMDATGALPTWTLANHDVHRAVTRFGLTGSRTGPAHRPRGVVDIELGLRRARAAALLVLALPGAFYLYQGEELGLPEVLDLDDADRRDPTFHRSGGAEYGRDGCRIPMPWHGTEAPFGFSDGTATWLPQPPWFAEYTVVLQTHDHRSTWTLYRDALRLRRDIAGEVEWLETGRDDVLAFSRGDHTCVTVFGDHAYDHREHLGQIVLRSSDTAANGSITTWFRREGKGARL
jgi:alpha-glucosidase